MARSISSKVLSLHNTKSSMSADTKQETVSDEEETVPKEVDRYGNIVLCLSSAASGSKIRIVEAPVGIGFSEMDVAMAVTGKNNDQAGCAIRRLPNEILKEIRSGSYTHKFKGRGQQESTIITIDGALKLAMVLPGLHARSMRVWAIGEMTQQLESLKQGKFLRYVLQSSLAIHVSNQVMSNESQMKYIYATESDAFPGLIKIGRTQDIIARVSNLGTATAPKPHRLVTMAPTLNNKRDEKWAHQHFAAKRVAGEFFKVSVDEVMSFFHGTIIPLYNIEMGIAEEDLDEGSESVLGKRDAPEEY